MSKANPYYALPRWRGGRVAEGARLESVYTGNRIEGSNPSLSASRCRAVLRKPRDRALQVAFILQKIDKNSVLPAVLV